ncbi:hypothetical protein [Leucothrix pacifica]|uniref:Uncharacterized protein n=1 Tax=Leucothrix pacifica TaxID=1247513 RepID=A0A317C1L3_9GAMM|nr:hypothetical protein [Leucothrix pacifica]PWQ92536.1 hypothetical protein DKW60_20650 [Leucothrix pacifica]
MKSKGGHLVDNNWVFYYASKSINIYMIFKKIILYTTLFTTLSASLHAAPNITNSIVKEHFEEAGGEGVDIVTMRKPKAFVDQCGTISAVSINYTQRRYGKVTVDQRTVKACTKIKSCELRLIWLHAPAGRLSYSVKAHWTKTACSS